jgi:hypothetical protein
MVSRSFLILAAIMLAVPSLAEAQPAPSASGPSPHEPRINQDWNADHFHFDYDDGVCHMVFEYNFKNGETHLDRHGDCSSVSGPRF